MTCPVCGAAWEVAFGVGPPGHPSRRQRHGDVAVCEACACVSRVWGDNVTAPQHLVALDDQQIAGLKDDMRGKVEAVRRVIRERDRRGTVN